MKAAFRKARTKKFTLEMSRTLCVVVSASWICACSAPPVPSNPSGGPSRATAQENAARIEASTKPSASAAATTEPQTTVSSSSNQAGQATAAAGAQNTGSPVPTLTPKPSSAATTTEACTCEVEGPARVVQNYLRIKCPDTVYLVPVNEEVETENGKICKNPAWVMANLFE